MNEVRDGITREAELSNCTFVKTVLMLLIVAYHCMVFWTGTWFSVNPVYESNILYRISVWFSSFHIYGFALVSGYLFFFLKCEKGKYSSFIPFAVNKAKRLLVPYIFVSLVWVIPFAMYYFHLDTVVIIKRYLLGTNPNQLWFLLMLFFVFMVFYPLTGFFEKHSIGGALTVLAIYGIGLAGAQVLPNIFQIIRVCTYLPLFWLGFKIRQYGSQRLMRIPSLVWIAVDVLLFTLVQYLSGFDATLIKLLNLGLTFLLHIIGALIAFVVLQKLANRVNWKESKVFTLLSKNSMPVYLFHQQVIYVFISLLNGVINPYLHAGINFIGAMTVSLLISTLLMKFKWTRFLIGEK
ncbi:MAG: acyltransferase family protein [Oscillospiraceae bacterium]